MIAFSIYKKLPLLQKRIVQSFINNHSNLINLALYHRFPYSGLLACTYQRIWPVFFTYRYMAGHAKWQNVKHVKAERDRAKAVLFNKYIRLINIAVREKGPDPKGNNKLANLLELARKDNVPNATIESALKRAKSKKLQVGTIEMLGPGGSLVIMEYETDNICTMRHQLKFICRKHSAGIFPGSGGKWRAAYEQKGIIKVTGHLNGQPLDGEKMLDAAIEAGAEDVQKIDEDDGSFYEFRCAPDDLMDVKKEIEKTFVIEEAYVGYLPISTVKLSDEEKTLALNFLNEVGDMPDVSRLYENIE